MREDLKIDLGDLGKFTIVDDRDLGFSVFKDGQEKKLFWVNSRGEEELSNWLKKKREN